MNKEIVIKRALRKAGYDIASRGFENSSINTTSKEILNEMVLDIQKETGLRNNIRFAVLTELPEDNSFYLDDIRKMYENAKFYQLPEDFLEYIGSTRNNNRSVILGPVIAVIPTVSSNIFEDGNDFSIEYRYKQQIEELPDILETYSCIKLAYELVLSLRADDGNRIQLLKADLAEELTSLRSLQNLEFGLSNQFNIGGSQFKWR